MKKKLVVIGAGMASGRLLEHLFETAPDAWEVTERCKKGIDELNAKYGG